MNRIPLETSLVTLLGVDAEFQAVGEAHRSLVTAIEAAQRKLDQSPLAPHIAKSVSFDHGVPSAAVLRVDVEGVFAVLDGTATATVPTANAPASTPPGPITPAVPTADEIRARAKQLGFDLGTRPLRSNEQKIQAWEEMDTFEAHGTAPAPVSDPVQPTAPESSELPEEVIDRLVDDPSGTSEVASA